MRIYFSPICGLKLDIQYAFSGDKIAVTIGDITDEFDFSTLDDGRLDIFSISTTLPYQPIRDVEKVGGILFVKVANPITDEATEFQRFPEWIEVGEV